MSLSSHQIYSDHSRWHSPTKDLARFFDGKDSCHIRVKVEEQILGAAKLKGPTDCIPFFGTSQTLWLWLWFQTQDTCLIFYVLYRKLLFECAHICQSVFLDRCFFSRSRFQTHAVGCRTTSHFIDSWTSRDIGNITKLRMNGYFVYNVILLSALRKGDTVVFGVLATWNIPQLVA